jgi:hypothetical protein
METQFRKEKLPNTWVSTWTEDWNGELTYLSKENSWG